MTADEARQLTKSLATLGGTMAMALESITRSARMGLQSATVFVPISFVNINEVEKRLHELGYQTDTMHDLVVIKW